LKMGMVRGFNKVSESLLISGAVTCSVVLDL
jgi:hypothetical protein